MDIKYGNKISIDEFNFLRKMEPFYKKFGFEERPNDKVGAGMTQWITYELNDKIINRCKK